MKQVKLSELVTLQTNKVESSQAIATSYVSTENLQKNKNGVTFPATVVPSTGKVNSYNIGDILVSNIRPYFKKIWKASKTGTHSGDVLNFRTTSPILSQEYLYVLLESDSFFDYMMLTSKGTKMPRGDKKAILNFEFNLPKIPEQQKLSNTILVLESKILTLKQINDNLLELVRLKFKHITQNVPTEKLQNIATIVMGQSPKSDTYNNNSIGLPLLNGATDFKGRVVNPGKWTSDPKKITNYGDYVFGVRATLGLTTKVFDEYAIGRGTGAAHAKSELMDEYLYFVLEDLFDFFEVTASGSVYLNISANDFKNYQAPAVSMYQINEFHQFARPIMDQFYSNQNEIVMLSEIRDTLLGKLIS